MMNAYYNIVIRFHISRKTIRSACFDHTIHMQNEIQDPRVLRQMKMPSIRPGYFCRK